MRLPTRAAAAALLVSLVALAGCDNKTKLVPVSGRVLIDGQPLTHGVVQVVPAGYRAASGTIGPDGRFTLTTSAEGDGCVVGTHPAAVIAHEALGPGAQRWHAPKKYIDAATSGLTVTVDGPTNDLTINLTWDGGAPFVERFGKE
jgi:hypothetical protein